MPSVSLSTSTKIEGFSNGNIIRVGSLPNLITYFLPKYIDKFKSLDHEVFIDSLDTNSELIASLDNDLFNIVFVSDSIEKPNFVTIPLVVEPFFVVMSSTNYLAKIDEIDFFTNAIIISITYNSIGNSPLPQITFIFGSPMEKALQNFPLLGLNFSKSVDPNIMS